MVTKKSKREAWFCIVLCEGTKLPSGADGPMRAAVARTTSTFGLKIISLSSGWGMSEEDAKKTQDFVIGQTKPQRIIEVEMKKEEGE